MRTLAIFTDGSCRFNGKDKNFYSIESNKNQISYGGWAFIVVDGEKIIEQNSGAQFETTNNRMELEAFYQALQYIHENADDNIEYAIYSDSRYVTNTMLFHVHKWRRNGWKTSMGDPVKNREQIEKVFNYLVEVINLLKTKSNSKLKIRPVKAHQSSKEKLHFYNNVVDKLAQKSADEYLETNKDKYKQIVEQKKKEFIEEANEILFNAEDIIEF